MMSQHTTSQQRVRTRSTPGCTMKLPFLPIMLVALLATLSCALAGCVLSTPGTGAPRATATSAPTATPTPPPAVTVAVTVEQQGTVAARNVHLLATVAVTNHTDRAINITIPDSCSPNPPILIEVVDTTGKTIWETNIFLGASCPYIPPRDLFLLPPGATHSWSIPNDLSHNSVEFQYVNLPPGPPPLVANGSYTVRAALLYWHQGSVADIGNPNILQGGHVVGEAVVVLR